jgi:biofilm protein TabA
MIFDKIENLTRYTEIERLSDYPSMKYKKGKFDIDGQDFFGIGLEYTTRSEKDCLWEGHKTYLDVHVILSGEEKVFVTDLADAKSTQEYDSENDYELFNCEAQQEIILRQGYFLVLYPNEVHKTAVVSEKHGISDVRKIVFKLKL